MANESVFRAIGDFTSLLNEQKKAAAGFQQMQTAATATSGAIDTVIPKTFTASIAAFTQQAGAFRRNLEQIRTADTTSRVEGLSRGFRQATPAIADFGQQLSKIPGPAGEVAGALSGVAQAALFGGPLAALAVGAVALFQAFGAGAKERAAKRIAEDLELLKKAAASTGPELTELEEKVLTLFAKLKSAGSIGGAFNARAAKKELAELKTAFEDLLGEGGFGQAEEVLDRFRALAAAPGASAELRRFQADLTVETVKARQAFIDAGVAKETDKRATEALKDEIAVLTATTEDTDAAGRELGDTLGSLVGDLSGVANLSKTASSALGQIVKTASDLGDAFKASRAELAATQQAAIALAESPGKVAAAEAALRAEVDDGTEARRSAVEVERDALQARLEGADAARELADAEREVADASDAVQAAADAELAARDELTKAGAEYADALADALATEARVQEVRRGVAASTAEAAKATRDLADAEIDHREALLAKEQAARHVEAAEKALNDLRRNGGAELVREQEAANRDLIAADADLADAERDLADAISGRSTAAARAARDRDLEDATRELADAQVEGAERIEDAQRRVADVTEQGAQRVADAQQRQKDAARDLADATAELEQIMRGYARGTEEAEEAVRALEEAQRAASFAELDLEDQRARVAELEERSRGGDFGGVNDAEQRLADARRRLAEATSASQRTSAAQAVREAEEALAEARREAPLEAAQAARDLARARLQLAQAEDRLAESRRRAAEQSGSTAQTLGGASNDNPAAQAAAARVQAAQEAKAAADAAVAQAKTEAATAIAEAQRQVQEATAEMARVVADAQARIAEIQNRTIPAPDIDALRRRVDEATAAAQDARAKYEDLVRNGPARLAQAEVAAQQDVEAARLAQERADLRAEQSSRDLSAAASALNEILHGSAEGSDRDREATDKNAAAHDRLKSAGDGVTSATQGLTSAQEASVAAADRQKRVGEDLVGVQDRQQLGTLNTRLEQEKGVGKAEDLAVANQGLIDKAKGIADVLVPQIARQQDINLATADAATKNRLFGDALAIVARKYPELTPVRQVLLEIARAAQSIPATKGVSVQADTRPFFNALSTNVYNRTYPPITIPVQAGTAPNRAGPDRPGIGGFARGGRIRPGQWGWVGDNPNGSLNSTSELAYGGTTGVSVFSARQSRALMAQLWDDTFPALRGPSGSPAGGGSGSVTYDVVIHNPVPEKAGESVHRVLQRHKRNGMHLAGGDR